MKFSLDEIGSQILSIRNALSKIVGNHQFGLTVLEKTAIGWQGMISQAAIRIRSLSWKFLSPARSRVSPSAESFDSRKERVPIFHGGAENESAFT